MIKRSLFSLVLIPICFSSLQFYGCTVIGYAIGASADSHTPDYDSLLVRQLPSLERGTTVVVTGKDMTVGGEYLGVQEVPFEEYRARYSNWRAQLSDTSFMPSLGDTISLVMNPGNAQTVEGQILGFDPAVILMKFKGENDTTAVEHARLVSHLQSISDKKGHTSAGKTIQAMMNENDVPLRSEMIIERVEKPADSVRISLDRIRGIQKKNSKNGALTGFLCGITIDALIVVAFIVGWNQYAKQPFFGSRLGLFD
jgi:hypothetical protein